jgi:hypothetical protein
MSEDKELDLFARNEMLTAELRKMSADLSREKAKKVDLEEAIILAAQTSFATLPALKLPAPNLARKPGRDPEVAYAHCSDWHIGFDPLEVTQRRVDEYRDKIVRITEIQRADHQVDDIHLAFLGDICHGEQIYPASPYEQTASLIDQAITDGADLVCRFIVDLLATFRNIHIPWLAGNHGWLGARKGGVYDPDSNLDRAMGLIVQRRLEASGVSPSRITFDIPRAKRNLFGSMTVDRVGEWSVLLLHGHLLKGQSSYGGLPYYGFDKKGLSLGHLGDHGTLPQFKDISCGHYHRIASIPIMSDQLRVCGTLQSQTSFEVETLATFSRPAQYLMFVEPKAGRVTAEYPVWLS